MLDIQTGCWLEITFIEGYEPRCTLSNILYGIMYRFRVLAVNDAGASEPGPPSEPVVVDVPGVQIAPYFVQVLGDTIALEHEKVRQELGKASSLDVIHVCQFATDRVSRPRTGHSEAVHPVVQGRPGDLLLRPHRDARGGGGGRGRPQGSEAQRLRNGQVRRLQRHGKGGLRRSAHNRRQ